MEVFLWTVLVISSLVKAGPNPGDFSGCKLDKEEKAETRTVLAAEDTTKNDWLFLRCVNISMCGQLPVCKKRSRSQAKECGGELSFLRKFVVSRKARRGFDKYCCTYVPIPTVKMWKQCFNVRVRALFGLKLPGKAVSGGRRRSRTRRRPRNPRSSQKEEDDSKESPKINVKRLRSGSEIKAAIANSVEKRYIPKKFFPVKEIRRIKKTESGAIYRVTICQIYCEEEEDREEDKEDQPDEKENENNKENENKENNDNNEKKSNNENKNNNENESGNEGKTITGNLNGEGGWGGCIGGGGLVDTLTGPKRVDQLQLGDQVLMRGDAFGPVKWMHHSDQNATGHFLIFRTEHGHEIALTHHHLVFQTNCQSDLTGQYVFAQRLAIGSCLKTRDPKTNRYEASKVVSIEEVEQKGLYAPITEAGSILVNGVLVSCYSHLENQLLAQRIHEMLFQVSPVLEKLLLWLNQSQTPTPEVPRVIQFLQRMASVVVANPNLASITRFF